MLSIADDAVDFALANLLENADLMLSKMCIRDSININVDGGTPKSTDLLLVKGGTPFTTDYDKYIAGTSHTI